MPSLAKRLRRVLRDMNIRREYAGLSVQEAFNKIYQQRAWGKMTGGGGDEFRYYSGLGSHDKRIIRPYIHAVTAFLESRPDIKTAVDLGCGDFNVGQHLCPGFDSYLAVDISAKVIAQNRANFTGENLSFLQANILQDDLPSADVYFLRQVLQHLSNADIVQCLRKIQGKYRYLVVTETLCKSKRFKPNRDIVSGPNVRFHKRSGVVLTAPPFGLSAKGGERLCEVANGREFIQTNIYLAPDQA